MFILLKDNPKSAMDIEAQERFDFGGNKIRATAALQGGQMF